MIDQNRTNDKLRLGWGLTLKKLERGWSLMFDVRSLTQEEGNDDTNWEMRDDDGR